jgi:hypothetical protein
VPPINFRIKNGKQTPSGTTILRRVRRQLLRQQWEPKSWFDDLEIVAMAIRDVDICLSKCHKEWRSRF